MLECTLLGSGLMGWYGIRAGSHSKVPQSMLLILTYGVSLVIKVKEFILILLFS